MDTKQVRDEGLDKFYTKPEIVKMCISRIKDWSVWDLVVEPSAGSGNFFEQIPNTNSEFEHIFLELHKAGPGGQIESKAVKPYAFYQDRTDRRDRL